MTWPLELLRRYWPVLALVATLAGGYWAGHVQGVNSTQSKWETSWAQRDTDDATARADAEKAERAKEQASQQHAEKVQRDATQALEQERLVAAGERAATERVRSELAKLQTRLRGAGASPATGTSSASATRAAMVLSELYGSCQSRLGELGSAFDRARIAGLACEAQIDGLGQPAGRERPTNSP